MDVNSVVVVKDANNMSNTLSDIIKWLINTNDGAYVFAALVIVGLLGCVSAIVFLFYLYRNLYASKVSDRDIFQQRISDLEKMWYNRYEDARKDTINIQLKNFEVLNGLKEAFDTNNDGINDLVDSLNKIFSTSVFKPAKKPEKNNTKEGDK